MTIQTDRGAPYGAEIGGEPSPSLPDPDHAGVGSRHTGILKNRYCGCPTWDSRFFVR